VGDRLVALFPVRTGDQLLRTWDRRLPGASNRSEARAATTVMSTYSPFTVTSQGAQSMIRETQVGDVNENLKCFMLQINLSTVYGGSPIPQSCYKKLPRLINGIPLGAGRLSRTQEEGIQWKYLEGSRDTQTFISVPVSQEEAERAKRTLKESLIIHSKQVFGDLTVKASLQLSQCLSFDSDFFVNDIADSLQEGLHFHDS